MKLYENGAYLVNGRDVVINSPEAASAVNAKTGKTVTPEDAKKQTIAYGILKNHNTSGNMEKLQIKFDKLTSHDITFVGIIQTARASGLEKFPIPYVLTNCHNSLCAVGGTINEDDHMFGLTCAKKYGGIYVPLLRGTCQVNADNSRHINIVGFIQKLLYKLRTTFSNCHGSQCSVTGMGV